MVYNNEDAEDLMETRFERLPTRSSDPPPDRDYVRGWCSRCGWTEDHCLCEEDSFDAELSGNERAYGINR